MVTVKDDDSQYTHTSIKWNDSLRDDLRGGIIGRLTDFNSVVNNIDAYDKSSVNLCVEKFTQIINDVAKPLFCKSKTYKKVSSSSCYNKRLCNKSEWFDEECKTAKQLYHSSLQLFNAFKSDENRQNMCTLKTKYKISITKKSKPFNTARYEKLKK